MMERTRFLSLRWLIAVLSSLWFVARVADVCESLPGLAYFQPHENEEDEHQSAPMPEDAQEEEGDSDEEPDEAKFAQRSPSEGQPRMAGRRNTTASVERLSWWWLGMPPTPPPERGC